MAFVIADLHETHNCRTNIAAKLSSQNETKKCIFLDIVTVFNLTDIMTVSGLMKAKSYLPSWLFAWGLCEAGCRCPAEP